MEEVRNRVRQLIAKGQTEEAIELLAQHQLNVLDKELIILNSRYSRVKENLKMDKSFSEQRPTGRSIRSTRPAGYGDQYHCPPKVAVVASLTSDRAAGLPGLYFRRH